MLATQFEQRALRSAGMSFQRMCLRQIARFSSKLLCDQEVNYAIGLPGPDDILLVEQARVLLDLVEQGPGFIWERAIFDEIIRPS